MSALYKTANAYIIPPAAKRPVWLVEAKNPEYILVRLLREFFLEMDINGIYAENFSGVRVDSVHPFAMLLFQEVSGTPLQFDVFPAVTISDTVENEDFVTLGREFGLVSLDKETVVELKGHKTAGRILVSDDAFARLETAVASGGFVIAEKGEYTGSHRVDFNIWGDNKELVSDLYDMVKLFVNTQRNYLHEQGIDIIGNLDGRRSGDINIEFGMLLFGANVTIPCTIKGGAMKVNVNTSELIQSADTVTRPTYHTEE